MSIVESILKDLQGAVEGLAKRIRALETAEPAAGGGGGTPATTVESETAWGIAPDVGTGTKYAREDHTHGTPDEPLGAGDMVKTTYDPDNDNIVESADYAATAGDSDLLDGQHAAAFSASGHTHPLSGLSSYNAGSNEITNADDPTLPQSLVTRSYMEAQLAGLGGTAAQGTFLVSGGGVTWTTGYTYTVAAGTGYIDGTLYYWPQQDVTLDPADATNDRIDVIAVNTGGVAVAITGQAAPDPSEPVVDPSTQLRLAIVTVSASTTEPTVTTVLMYQDNGGSGGAPVEWDWSTSGSGFNVNSSNNPRGGSGKDIEGTTVAASAYAQGQAGAGTVDPNSYEQLVFYIRFKASWNANRYLLVQLQNAGVRKGNALRVAGGYFGLDGSDTTNYQAVIIPTLQFAIPAGVLINQIRFIDVGGSIGFYIDDVILRATGAGGGSTGGITQDQADARYAQRANDLSDLASISTARTNLGVPALVSPSVVDNFVSFSSITGEQKDSGSKASDFATSGHTHAQLHDAATVTDTSTVDLSITGQQISANVIPGGIDHGALAGLTDADHPASAITADTAGFAGNLSAADDTVQKALDTIDDLVLGGTPDASVVTYTPAVLADWNGDADPGDVDNALDQLAERVDDLEAVAVHRGQAAFSVDGAVATTTGKMHFPNKLGVTLTINKVTLIVAVHRG